MVDILLHRCFTEYEALYFIYNKISDYALSYHYTQYYDHLFYTTNALLQNNELCMWKAIGYILQQYNIILDIIISYISYKIKTSNFVEQNEKICKEIDAVRASMDIIINMLIWYFTPQ